ncbi:MAG: 2-dehydropantoate 2-reductase N-terminal domain-containing protein [Bifidobacterium sp.]|nr:2-dehydropantoate 2-reductase N-terminal domain-containing protein [Bifidobacterium sp.]
MHILVIGLGVIGTTYGYLFQRAGLSVEHYVRASSARYGVRQVTVEMLDGRANGTPQWTRGTYHVHPRSRTDYDFILVSVPGGGIASVARELRELGVTGTLVFACGIWQDRAFVGQAAGGYPYVLGYPVAGGRMEDGMLRCCVTGEFQMEAPSRADIPDYGKLERLFAAAGVTLRHPYDMLQWIWLHMAVNAGVVAVAASHGGTSDPTAAAERLMGSVPLLRETVRCIRQTCRIVASRGVPLWRFAHTLLPYALPTWLAAPLMRRLFARDAVTRDIMTLHHDERDLLYVCSNVYGTGRRNRVRAPLFYDDYRRALRGR